jgi:hypothetical protein
MFQQDDFGLLGQLAERTTVAPEEEQPFTGLLPLITDINTPGQMAGRLAELGIRGAIGLTAFGAGVERLAEAIPGRGELIGIRERLGLARLQDVQAGLEHVQDVVQEWAGNDPNVIIDIAGEILGTVPVAGVSLGSTNAGIRALLARGVGAGRPIPVETAIAVASRSQRVAAKVARTSALSAEGGLFIAGLPDTDVKDIYYGMVGGMVLAGGAEVARAFRIEKVLRRRELVAQSFDITKSVDEVSTFVEGVTEGVAPITDATFAKYLGQVDANIAATAHLGNALGDDAIAGLRLALSEAGAGGSQGIIRATDITNESLLKLADDFPQYRFERVEGELIYGLAPGIKLPPGTKRAPILSDEAVAFYKRTKLMKGQSVLVDGQVHALIDVSKVGLPGVTPEYTVRPRAGHSFKVSADRVLPLPENVSPLENPELFREFRIRLKRNPNAHADDVFEEFWPELGLDNALKPHLRDYFRGREAAIQHRRLVEAEPGLVDSFNAALRKWREVGTVTNQPLDVLAASRSHAVQRISGERIKLTNMWSKETRLVGPRGDKTAEEIARARLEGYEMRMPNVTPKIDGVPDELAEHLLVPYLPVTNQAIPTDDILITRAINRVKGQHKATVGLMTELGRHTIAPLQRTKQLEAITGERVWSAASQRVHTAATLANNRMRPRLMEASKIMGKLKGEDMDLVNKWLESGLKEGFAAQNMSPALLKRARRLRLLLNDVFDELSAQSGTTLVPEVYFQDYAPAVRSYVAQTGRHDVERVLFAGRRDRLPDDVRFFAELFKSGQLSTAVQDNLLVRVQRLIRAGYFKAYAGDEWTRAVTFAKTLKNDSPAKQALVDYLGGIRGMPDATRRELDRMFNEFFKGMGVSTTAKARANILDASIDLTYGGLIAYRPALIFRNLTQNHQLLAPFLRGDPARVHSKILRAQALAADPSAKGQAFREWAAEIGARRLQAPITLSETFEASLGGKFRRVTKGLSGPGIRLYGMSDDWNRTTAAIAVRFELEPLVAKYISGRMTATDLVRRSDLLDAVDEPVRQAFFQLLDGKQTELLTVGKTRAERAVNFMAREWADASQFLYGASNATPWVRTALGRVGGAYSTWPMGYLNWLRLAMKSSQPSRTGRGIHVNRRLMKHATFNLGLRIVGANLGINLTTWMAYRSLGFGGSPLVDFMGDLHTSVWGMPWQRSKARRNVARSAPRFFIPGGTLLFRDIPTALEALVDDDPRSAAAALAGFTLSREETGALKAFR